MKTTMLKLAVLAIAACGTLLAMRPAHATDVPATMTITAVRSLSLDTSTIDFGTPTLSDFTNAYTQPQDVVATIKSNDVWALKVHGSAAEWSATEGGWDNKPRSDIKFKSTGGEQDTYTALTDTGQNVYSGTATTTSGVTKTVTFKVHLDFETDSPATYTYENIVFTLSAS